MATRQRPQRRADEEYVEDDSLLAYESAFGLDEDITDEDIEEYLDEEAEKEERTQKKPGFLNLQTGSGLAIITIGTIYLLQQLGFFPLGYSLGALVAFLPWLAGILIILTGFGVLSWSPSRRRRRARRQARRSRARQEKTMGRQRARAAGNAAGNVASAAFERAKKSAERAASRTSSRAGTRREGRRRLAKSRSNKKIAGVAAGIANYLGLDPLLVRIAFVVGAIFGNGFTIPLYVILAFVLPKAEDEDTPPDDPLIRIVRD
jgi:phage shock protein C